MSTANKLSYLNDTKSLLRTSLNKFGSNILSTDTFRSYDTKLNEIYDKLPKITQSGAGFTLSEVQNGQVDDFKMNGVDLEQNTTNGINKFYLDNNYSANYGEASIEVNNNNSFILRMNKTSSNKQSPCATIEFNASYLKPNTTYTISKKNSNTGYVLEHVGSIRLYINGSYGSFIDADEYTFTTPGQITNFTILLYLFFGNSTPGNYEITFYDIQLEENSTATDFEPYTGGIPSPNPNYPQEIKVVEGRQVITNSGKNLLNISKNVNGYWYKNGVLTANGDWSYINDFIELKPNTQYTISRDSSELNESQFSIEEFDANKNYIKQNILWQNNTNKYSITTDSNTKYVICNYRNEYAHTDLQFESGDNRTDYEPYYEPVEYNIDLNLENIYLAKMPDTNYKNRIYKNNGNWYFEENVGKVILDGSDNEDWANHLKTKILSISRDHTFIIMCNYFKPTTNSSWVSNDDSYRGMCSSLNTVGQIKFMPLEDMTLNEFKTWLSTHNVEVWCQLDNPVTTQITNTTLINQLEALYLHTGTNIITISNDNNIIPEIEITRLKELEKLS